MVKRTRDEDSDASAAAQQLEAAAEAGSDEVRKLKVSAYALVRQPGKKAPAIAMIDCRNIVSWVLRQVMVRTYAARLAMHTFPRSQLAPHPVLQTPP